MKDEARDSTLPLKQIFERNLASIVDKGISLNELAKCKAKYNNVVNNLNKKRHENMPPIPKTQHEIDLTHFPQYNTTTSKERFFAIQY